MTAIVESATAPVPVPETGERGEVRKRQWVVSDVDKSTIPPNLHDPSPRPPQHLITLSSIEDDALGEELQVIPIRHPRGLHKTPSFPRCPHLDRRRQVDVDVAATNPESCCRHPVFRGPDHPTSTPTSDPNDTAKA